MSQSSTLATTPEGLPQEKYIKKFIWILYIKKTNILIIPLKMTNDARKLSGGNFGQFLSKTILKKTCTKTRKNYPPQKKPNQKNNKKNKQNKTKQNKTKNKTKRTSKKQKNYLFYLHMKSRIY